MAVVTVSSTQVANADAKPVVKNSAKVAEGNVMSSVGGVAIANGDSSTSVYRVLRIRSGTRVNGLSLVCDAITGAAADIGLYQIAAKGGAVVSQQFFAAAQSLASAQSGLPVAHLNLQKAGQIAQRVWEVLGLSADPGLEYDVAFTLTAGATAAGNAALKCDFVNSGPG